MVATSNNLPRKKSKPRLQRKNSTVFSHQKRPILLLESNQIPRLRRRKISGQLIKSSLILQLYMIILERKKKLSSCIKFCLRKLNLITCFQIWDSSKSKVNTSRLYIRLFTATLRYGSLNLRISIEAGAFICFITLKNQVIYSSPN